MPLDDAILIDMTSRVMRGFRENSFSLDITADEASSKLCVSKRTLFRHLQREGTTLKELQSLYRVEVLKPLLLNTSLPINRLAMVVGLHFRSLDRLFIKYVGMTPTQYRENFR